MLFRSSMYPRSLIKKQDHIDPGIFEIFLKERGYMDCAEEFLGLEQIDDIDEALRFQTIRRAPGQADSRALGSAVSIPSLNT